MHCNIMCDPRFNCLRSGHRIRKDKDGVYFVSVGLNLITLFLRTRVPLKVVNQVAVSNFTLHATELMAFVLEEAQSIGRSPSSNPGFISKSFKQTVNFWHNWIGMPNYRGHWHETVNHSALILKLLTSKPYSSLVASPTFDLSEVLMGERNWNYWYTCVRDASFNLYGLIRLGYIEAAAVFMRWIEDSCNDLDPDGSLQIIFRIDGSRTFGETKLPHFEVYMKLSLVRIRNGTFE